MGRASDPAAGPGRRRSECVGCLQLVNKRASTASSRVDAPAEPAGRAVVSFTPKDAKACTAFARVLGQAVEAAHDFEALARERAAAQGLSLISAQASASRHKALAGQRRRSRLKGGLKAAVTAHRAVARGSIA